MEKKKKAYSTNNPEKMDFNLQKMEFDFCLSPFTETGKKKCIKELYLEPKALKLLEENTESIFQDIGIVKNF